MRSTTGLPLFALALTGLVIGLVVGPVPEPLAAPTRAAPAAKKPKYYFKVIEVKSATADDVTKATAMKLLEAELSGRPEFTPDLPGATDPDTVAVELRARKLQGFQVTMD